MAKRLRVTLGLPVLELPLEMWLACFNLVDLATEPASALALVGTCHDFAALLQPRLRAWLLELLAPGAVAPCLANNRLGDADHRLRVSLLHYAGSFGELRALAHRAHLAAARPADELYDAATLSELLYPLVQAQLHGRLLYEHTELGLFQRALCSVGVPNATTPLRDLFYQAEPDGPLRCLRHHPSLHAVEMPRDLVKRAAVCVSNYAEREKRAFYAAALDKSRDLSRRALCYSVLRDELPRHRPHRDSQIQNCVWLAEGESQTFTHVFLGEPPVFRLHGGARRERDKVSALAYAEYHRAHRADDLRRFHSLFGPKPQLICIVD